ncbi:MAG: FAD-binding protein [Thermoguttaceae bacterium]
MMTISSNITCVHTLVLGSGAAGLQAAVQLWRRGVRDVLIVTEGVECGTSINTGSDKQTYYKLGVYGGQSDSPREMAETFAAGGATDGDTALVEAALSVRGFYNLIELGVEFPCDAFGQYAGYKTDHDPRQRATSIGPYTSQAMCRALLAEVKRLGIRIRELCVGVKILTQRDADTIRACGLFVVNTASSLDSCLELILCENLVLACGGPGGLYRDSVYPLGHTGGIGLALEAGATAQNLAESQFGLASTAFRWNVSGTYMQVVPQIVSTASDGVSDVRDLLGEYFVSPSEAWHATFLKGYQWPFDAAKVGGSSLIDLIVYRETVERRRRVFLDYRSDPHKFSLSLLPDEVCNYLERSGATMATPIARLAAMNPQAIELYKSHGIDLRTEKLEIALCAQHNNGGLSVGRFWESINVRHLFAAGEVAGTHGVTRPGGAALNAGQVAGFRIADYIAARYAHPTLDRDAAAKKSDDQFASLAGGGLQNWERERALLQARMSDAAAAIVDCQRLDDAVRDATSHATNLAAERFTPRDVRDLAESLRTRSLLLASLVYLRAVQENLVAGSRGSRVVLAGSGAEACAIHPNLLWMYKREDAAFRNVIAETEFDAASLQTVHRHRPCRPIPVCDAWFETAWSEFRSGRIFE